MPSDNNADNPTQDFIQHLEGTGFFDQISNLEGSLKSIVGEIESFNETSNQRQEETENLAAHVLAIESLLGVILKKIDVTEEEVIAESKSQATALAGKEAQNPTVEAIASDLLRKAKA